MKNLFLIFLLQFFTATHFAQGVITPIWMKSKFSSSGGKTEGWGVDVDNNGNVYWPVSSDSAGLGLDNFCYKFDPNGIPLWTTPLFFGGAGTQHAFVCNAKDTALYIGGRYCALFGTSCDMQLLKVDKSTGVLIWARTKDFGNDGYDEIDGLEITNDGIYCGGWAQALQTGAYQLDVGLWKVDFNGNTIWSNYFGKTGTAEHIDGHFVLDNDFIYGAGEWDGKGIANLYNGNSFLGKFSKTDGSFVDSALFGFQSNSFLDVENALGITSDGTYLYITGYSTPVSSTDWQIFIAKFDKDMNQHWFKTWGGSSSETARGIAVDNGFIFVAGVTTSPGYNPAGKADGVLLAYDTAGNFITYKTWGDTLDNEFRDIAISGTAIYLVGSSGNNLFNGDSDSGFIMKVNMNSILASVNENSDRQLSLKVYPNPCNNTMLIYIYDLQTTILDLKIFDMLGQIVLQETLNSNHETMNLNLPGGLYFYQVKNKTHSIDTGKIIIQ